LTKDGLTAARVKGKLLGRPKGSLGKSQLQILLEQEVSKANAIKLRNSHIQKAKYY
jgi:hypothetical protein